MVRQAGQTVDDLRTGLEQCAQLRRIVLESFMDRLVDQGQGLLEFEVRVEEARCG